MSDSDRPIYSLKEVLKIQKEAREKARVDAIDELKEKFLHEVDGNIFSDAEKFKYSRKDQEKICCQNIAWKKAKRIFEYLAEELKEQKK